MVVLGIDPGSRHTGYGVIECDAAGQERIIEYGVLNLDVHKEHQVRLKQIYTRLLQVVERCLPDQAAVEMPVYGRNPQSMLKLGRAQAAAMLVVLNREIPVTEYTPKEVKKSVTGNGNATKEQVWYMVRAILSIEAQDPEMGLDASDAIAIALCHAHRQRRGGTTTRHKDWGSFLRANPDRLG